MYSLNTAWSKNTVTYNSPWSKRGGDYGSTALAINTNTATKVWEEFDVTKPITDAVKNGKPCNGFIIAMPWYGLSQHFTAWYNSSRAEDATLRPKLSIYTGLTEVSTSQQALKTRSPFRISCQSRMISVSSANAGTVAIMTPAGKNVARFSTVSAGTRMIPLDKPIAQGAYIAVLTTPEGIISVRPLTVTR